MNQANQLFSLLRGKHRSSASTCLTVILVQFFLTQQPNAGLGCLIVDVSRPHTIRHTHPIGIFWTSDKPVVEAGTDTTHKYKRRTLMPSAEFEKIKRVENQTLDSMAIWIRLQISCLCYPSIGVTKAHILKGNAKILRPKKKFRRSDNSTSPNGIYTFLSAYLNVFPYSRRQSSNMNFVSDIHLTTSLQTRTGVFHLG